MHPYSHKTAGEEQGGARNFVTKHHQAPRGADQQSSRLSVDLKRRAIGVLIPPRVPFKFEYLASSVLSSDSSDDANVGEQDIVPGHRMREALKRRRGGYVTELIGNPLRIFIRLQCQVAQ